VIYVLYALKLKILARNQSRSKVVFIAQLAYRHFLAAIALILEIIICDDRTCIVTVEP